ncbi:hypothetical protein PO909_033629 [Leuciscus waleckii]
MHRLTFMEAPRTAVQQKSKAVSLIAVYEEQEAQQRGAMSPGNGTRTSSSLTGQSSPEPYDSELACFQPIKGGEIEVNSSALKSRSDIHLYLDHLLKREITRASVYADMMLE